MAGSLRRDRYDFERQPFAAMNYILLYPQRLHRCPLPIQFPRGYHQFSTIPFRGFHRRQGSRLCCQYGPNCGCRDFQRYLGLSEG